MQLQHVLEIDLPQNYLVSNQAGKGKQNDYWFHSMFRPAQYLPG